MLSRIYCRCYQSQQVEACSEYLDPLNMTSYSSLTGNPTQYHLAIKLLYIISSSANPGYLGRCVRSIIAGHSGDDIICQVGHFSTFFILLFTFLRTQCPSIQTMQLSALLWDRWALWNQRENQLETYMYVCDKSLFEIEFECYCLIRLLKNSSHRCTLWYSSDWVHNI